jgi:hypothetical protein
MSDDQALEAAIDAEEDHLQAVDAGRQRSTGLPSCWAASVGDGGDK